MSASAIIPLLSTVVAVIFSSTIFFQYAERRRPYQLIWGIGLFWYAVASWSRFLVGVGVWNPGIYRVWYLFGAVLVAAYLGMGTVYLLAPLRTARVIMFILALGSIFATYLVLTAPVDLSALPPNTLRAGALPGNIRVITAVFNIFGSLALVGGALYSAWALWRQRSMPERVLSNVLIAVGGFLPTAGGSLSVLGIADPAATLEFFGILIIFAGFLANHEVIASRFAWKAKTAP